MKQTTGGNIWLVNKIKLTVFVVMTKANMCSICINWNQLAIINVFVTKREYNQSMTSQHLQTNTEGHQLILLNVMSPQWHSSWQLWWDSPDVLIVMGCWCWSSRALMSESQRRFLQRWLYSQFIGIETWLRIKLFIHLETSGSNKTWGFMPMKKYFTYF